MNEKMTIADVSDTGTFDAPSAGFTCFHCGEHYASTPKGLRLAAEHFGTHPAQSPACLIDITEYRRMETQAARYADEDADIHREMHRAQSAHAAAMQRAEETGYARGLRDSGKCPCAAAIEPVADGYNPTTGVYDEQSLRAAGRYWEALESEITAREEWEPGEAERYHRMSIAVERAISAHDHFIDETNAYQACDREKSENKQEAFPLNDRTLWIINLPHVTCISIAQRLRQIGHTIEYGKERAHVLLWMLNLYIAHGENWHNECDKYLSESNRIEQLSRL